jgi:hypothetical protein
MVIMGFHDGFFFSLCFIAQECLFEEKLLLNLAQAKYEKMNLVLISSRICIQLCIHWKKLYDLH